MRNFLLGLLIGFILTTCVLKLRLVKQIKDAKREAHDKAFSSGVIQGKMEQFLQSDSLIGWAARMEFSNDTNLAE